MIESNGSDIPSINNLDLVSMAVAWAMVKAAYTPLDDSSEQEINDYLKKMVDSFHKVRRAIQSGAPIQDN